MFTLVKVHMIIEADEKLDFDQNISQNLESQTISDEINHRFLTLFIKSKLFFGLPHFCSL